MGNDATAFGDDAVHLPSHVDLAAHGEHLFSDVLPELAGAELRVQEALDQRGVGALLRDVFGSRRTIGRWFRRRGESLLDEVFQRRRERKALDALRSPLGRDLVAGRAPDLLGVALEERKVELAAEAIDEEVFEALLFLDGPNAAHHVADTDLRHPHRAEIRDGVARELDRVVEELA
jgi:hypothetical protein